MGQIILGSNYFQIDSRVRVPNLVMIKIKEVGPYRQTKGRRDFILKTYKLMYIKYYIDEVVQVTVQTSQHIACVSWRASSYDSIPFLPDRVTYPNPFLRHVAMACNRVMWRDKVALLS